MRICEIIQGDSYRLQLWLMGRNDDALRQELLDVGCDLTPTDGWHQKRQREWIAGRYLIDKNINQPINNLLISPTGKPYFKKGEEHFSISHSSELVGIGISKYKIGIDIQKTSTAVDRTANKFIIDDNLNRLPGTIPLSSRRHHIWTIKEAIFKAYGLGKVDFKNDIKLSKFKNYQYYRSLNSTLISKFKNYNYFVHFWKMNDYYFAVAIEDD